MNVRRIDGQYVVRRPVVEEHDSRPTHRTGTHRTADGHERSTRTRPAIETRTNARVRQSYDTNAFYRERLLQQGWSDQQPRLPGARREPEPTHSLDPSNPAVLAGQLAYLDWSDPQKLESDLKAQPNLREYSGPEIEAMAMLAIENPSVRPALQEAVAETVKSIDSLDQLPQTAGFQFLLSSQLLDVPGDQTQGFMYGPRAHLKQLVEDEVSRSFDRNLEGAKGDDEVDRAGERFRADLQALAEKYPALIEDIDSAARQVASDNADEIQDHRRADDNFFSKVNHTVTGGIRGAASALADFIAPDIAGGGGVLGPDWLTSSTFRNWSDVGAGFVSQFHSSIESPAQIVTDPVGAAKAILEVARHPSLLLQGYKDVYAEHGANGVTGAIGFDMLSVVLSVGTGSEAFLPLSGVGSAIARGATHVLGDLIPTDKFLKALRKSDGFGALDATEQATLLRWADGREPFISPQMRETVEDALRATDEFDGLTTAEREAMLLRLGMDPPKFLYDLHSVPSPVHFKPNAQGVLSRATPTDLNLWTSPEDAVVQTLKIDGRDIRIISPADGDTRNSVEEVVEAIRAMPREARNQLHTVLVEPAGHGRADAASAADGNPVVALYNNGGDPLPHDKLVTVLVHESGHVMSFDRWGGTMRGADWDRWKQAMSSDRIRASSYASVDIGEDFAETFAVYNSVRGTEWEAAVRAKLPERFAILDEFIAAEGANSPAPPLR